MNIPLRNATLEPSGPFLDCDRPGMPPELRDAIATLHRARIEAANKVEELLAFLDMTDSVLQEPDVTEMLAARFGEDVPYLVDADFEPNDCDLEPSLCGVTVQPGDDLDREDDFGSFDRMTDQTKSTRLRPSFWPVFGAEQDEVSPVS